MSQDTFGGSDLDQDRDSYEGEARREQSIEEKISVEEQIQDDLD